MQRQLSEWAKEFGLWLVAGSLPTLIPQQNRVHTTSLVFNPQGELTGFITNCICLMWMSMMPVGVIVNLEILLWRGMIAAWWHLRLVVSV